MKRKSWAIEKINVTLVLHKKEFYNKSESDFNDLQVKEKNYEHAFRNDY